MPGFWFVWLVLFGWFSCWVVCFTACLPSTDKEKSCFFTCGFCLRWLNRRTSWLHKVMTYNCLASTMMEDRKLIHFKVWLRLFVNVLTVSDSKHLFKPWNQKHWLQPVSCGIAKSWSFASLQSLHNSCFWVRSNLLKSTQFVSSV